TAGEIPSIWRSMYKGGKYGLTWPASVPKAMYKVVSTRTKQVLGWIKVGKEKIEVFNEKMQKVQQIFIDTKGKISKIVGKITDKSNTETNGKTPGGDLEKSGVSKVELEEFKNLETKE